MNRLRQFDGQQTFLSFVTTGGTKASVLGRRMLEVTVTNQVRISVEF